MTFGQHPSWVTELNEAVHRSAQSPREAIDLLRQLHARPDVGGDQEAEHTVLFVLVGLMIHQRVELALAKTLAERLLKLCPDRMHHAHLAEVLRLSGDEVMALESDKAASLAPNLHATPEDLAEYERIMAIVIANEAKER